MNLVGVYFFSFLVETTSRVQKIAATEIGATFRTTSSSPFRSRCFEISVFYQFSLWSRSSSASCVFSSAGSMSQPLS